jgi:hypothetical protein
MEEVFVDSSPARELSVYRDSPAARVGEERDERPSGDGGGERRCRPDMAAMSMSCLV